MKKKNYLILNLTDMSFISDFWGYLRERKKWWLLPVIIFVLIIGVLLIVGSASPAGAFIYTLF